MSGSSHDPPKAPSPAPPRTPPNSRQRLHELLLPPPLLPKAASIPRAALPHRRDPHSASSLPASALRPPPYYLRLRQRQHRRRSPSPSAASLASSSSLSSVASTTASQEAASLLKLAYDTREEQEQQGREEMQLQDQAQRLIDSQLAAEICADSSSSNRNRRPPTPHHFRDLGRGRQWEEKEQIGSPAFAPFIGAIGSLGVGSSLNSLPVELPQASPPAPTPPPLPPSWRYGDGGGWGQTSQTPAAQRGYYRSVGRTLYRHERTPYSDPEQYMRSQATLYRNPDSASAGAVADGRGWSRGGTPFPARSGPRSSSSNSCEATPLSDGYSSYDEAYLRSPDPLRYPSDFTNDWQAVPTLRQPLWRPPSRDGLRRSSRLAKTYAPLVEEQRRAEAIYAFLTSHSPLPAPSRFLAAALAVFLATGVVFFFLLHSPSPSTESSNSSSSLSSSSSSSTFFAPSPFTWSSSPLASSAAALLHHLVQAAAPLHCLASPLCPAWQASRRETARRLLWQTHRHGQALAAFKKASGTIFPAVPQTLGGLARDIRIEAKLQDKLARTMDEAAAADALFALANELAAAARDLHGFQATIHSTLGLATTSLRRFAGYLLLQNPHVLPRVAPTAWKSGLPPPHQRPMPALQLTMRKNFRGHVSTLAVLGQVFEHQLLQARARVHDALAVLEARARAAGSRGFLDSLHRRAFFLLRLSLRQFDELVGGELNTLQLALVDSSRGAPRLGPGEGQEQGEGEGRGEALENAFESLYNLLATLEAPELGDNVKNNRKGPVTATPTLLPRRHDDGLDGAGETGGGRGLRDVPATSSKITVLASRRGSAERTVQRQQGEGGRVGQDGGL